MSTLHRWLERFHLRAPEELPPQLDEVPSLEDSRQLREQVTAEMVEREQYLRLLEAKANVRGGRFGGRHGNGNS